MAPVVQTWGDVFTFLTALAHAVSADLHMGAGVAVDFKQFFGRVSELRSQGKGVGEVAYLEHNGHYIFYLITKQHYWEKVVSLDMVLNCLLNLRALCISLGVEKVSMPRIGCGLDCLKFEDVLPRLLYAFPDDAVKINIVTPLPQVCGMAVAGDSQALRLLMARAKLPSGFNKSCRQVGLCGSGWTMTNLIDALNELPDNALDNVLVVIGTNDVLHMCQSKTVREGAVDFIMGVILSQLNDASGTHVRDLSLVERYNLKNPKALKNRLRHVCTVLRTTLSSKCKACCRAVVATVPPLPQILAPRDGDMDKASNARALWAKFNKRLLSLSTSRFHVLDLDHHFVQTVGDRQIIREDMFERFMGKDKREDRIHINNQGRRVLLEALSSIPPLTL